MSRAFVREEDDEPRPRRSYQLPERTDPGYDRAAAKALLDGASEGDTASAEAATGYLWGDPRLRRYVEELLQWARERSDERLEQVAARYLTRASKG